MNMLSSVTPWDMVAEGYSEVAMKSFQGYTDKALEILEIEPHHHVLDICCGPGTLALSAAKRARSVKAIDFSESMLTILDSSIKELALDNMEIHCGDAQALPYDDNSFDAAYSMFGLMFFPDRAKGYSEIHRILKPGARTVISSWAPVSQSPVMKAAFGGLRAMNPEIPEPQTAIDSLENPDFFKSELIDAGFKDVTVHGHTEHMQIDSVEDFWDNMIKGSAPLVMMKSNMSEELWKEKNKIALEYLKEIISPDTQSLSADAWLAVGTK